MKDGPVRSALKLVARGVTAVNLYGTRLLWRASGKRPYQLGGSCGRCSACCESPAIQVSTLTWYVPLLRRVFLAWHRHVNGFVLRSEEPLDRVFVFECSHFDRAQRCCDSYATRPLMCRDYPRNLLWTSSPRFLPSCGYRPVASNAAQLLEALRQEGLSPEQMETLKKKLHLE